MKLAFTSTAHQETKIPASLTLADNPDANAFPPLDFREVTFFPECSWFTSGSPIPTLPLPSLRTYCIPVGLPLVLNDHVFLVDRLQQGRGQRLQVSNGLRSSWEAAPVVFREQILD